LERAHSYKDKVAKGIAANHSLFSYPVLMAADILLYDSEVIPVGKDQIQHVEIARDIAIKFNNDFENVFTIPEYKVDEVVATVPGLDGAKMSKSYGNTINIFCTEKELKKACSKIVTDSTPMEEPKDFSTCNVYALAKLFLENDEVLALQQRYQKGGEGYGHFKAYLQGLIWNFFEEARDKRAYYLAHPNEVMDILEDGANKARKIANEKMIQVREIVGIYR
jgi:tryptophanyl-tRNA synthetase